MKMLNRFALRCIVLACASILILTKNSYSQDLNISGGNSISVSLCANGGIFAWGQNSQGNAPKVYGRLGTGNMTDDFVSSPVQVNVPAAALPIKQVDAGSGGHFIAMGCDGTVWGWGNNGTRQVGNTTETGDVVTVPTQVMAGEGTDGDSDGFLDGVAYISGGNDENYAILETGEIVAWGQNDEGQLGNGTMVDATTPVLVRTGPGVTLQNVIMVEAGDQTGYALVDPDGDGIGTVYSWGDGADGRLGRADAGNTYAAPVVRQDGSILDNIKSITGGDVMAFAIDEDDFVWSWGHGNWGQLTGINQNLSHPYALQVVGGATGSTYLQARAVSAGQGFGMAVTLDGRAVSWGNNNSNTNGGNLGDCGTAQSGSPVYMNTAPGTPITGVTNISDGDFWGFITKDDNTIWTWGGNGVGQLGLGYDGAQELCLVQMPAIPGCSFPDPAPIANLGVDTIYTCAAVSELLDPNFTNLDNDYDITWYHNDVPLGTNKTVTRTANDFGEWKVRISYVGGDSPCTTYEDALDSVVILENPITYSDPGSQTFCGATINANVTGNGAYDWYTTAAGGTLLGSSVGSGDASFPAASVTDVTGTTYTVYVEETAGSAGSVIPNVPASANNVSGTQFTDSDMFFTTNETVTIDSIDVMYRAYSATATLTIQLEVYGSKSDCGSKTVADKTNVLYTGAASTVHVTSVTSPGWDIARVPVNITLPPGTYFIGPSGGSSITNGAVGFINGEAGMPNNTNDLSNGNTARVDNVTGDIISVFGSDKGNCHGNSGELGLFHNWQFRTLPLACERVPVVIEESCPCDNPGTVSLSPAGPIAICGGSQTLTATQTGTHSGGGFDYEFFRGATSVQGPNGTNTYSALVAGSYTVVVTDPSAPASCNATSNAVSLTIDSPPSTADAGPAQTQCGSTTTATLAGNTPGSGTGAWTLVSGSGTVTTPSSPTSGITGLAVGANVFRWTISNGSCPDETDDVTITLDPVPSAAVAGTDQTQCELTTTATMAATAPATGTGTWSLVSGSGSATSVNSATSGVTGLAVGTNTFRWTVSAAGSCPDETDDVDIILEQAPSAAVAGTDITQCGSTTTATMAATAPAAGTGTWTLISGSGSATSSNSATSGVTGLAVGTNTFRWTVSTGGSCADETDDVDIILDPVPSAAVAGADQTQCESTTTATMAATAPVTGTGTWSLVSGSGSATSVNSETSGVTGLAVGTNTFRWTVSAAGSCPDETDDVDIIVNAEPSAPTVSTPVTYCEGETATALTATGSNLLWYTVAVGGTGSATAPTPSTATAGSTDHFVSQTVSGCEGPRATLTVDVNASPAAPTVSTPVTYCLNDASVALTATGTNLQWYTVAAGGTGSGVAPTPSTAAAGTVSYYVSQTVTGCEGPRAQIDVVTNDLPVPVIDPTSDMCEGSTVTFTNTAHTSGTYAWTVTGTGVSDNGSTTEDIDITAGSGNISISVIWTDGNGCSNNPAVTQNINVDAAPPVATTGGDINVCVVDPIALTGNNPNPGTGMWTIEPGSTAGITIDNPTQFNSNVSGFSAGGDVLIATWTISNGVCTPTDAQMTITGTGVADPIVNLSDDAGGAVCEGTTVNFTATPTNGGSSPMYTFLDANDNVLQAQSSTATLPLTVTQDTTVYVVLLSNSSCATDLDDTSVVINITVDPLPDAAVAGADFDVCTSTASLTANTPINGTGMWSSSTSAVVTTPTDPNSGVTALPIGTTTFIWTISSGSCPSTMDDIVINRAGTLTTSNVNGQSTTICESDAYPTLTGTPLNGAANPAESGSWTSLDGATITPSGIDATIDAASMNGENSYRFVYEISNGLCVPNSTDTVTITVDGLPTTAVAGTDDAICTDGYQLSGNAAIIGTGMWTADDPGVTFDDPTLFDAQASNIQAGTTNFVWTISNGTCTSSTDDVDITRSGSLTTPLAGTDQTICETGTATMTANAASGGETGTWSTSGDGGFDDTNSEVAIYTPGATDISSGSVTLTWTMSNGVCPDATSTMDVTIEATPTATITDPAGASKTINGTSTTLTAAAIGGTELGLWSKPNAGEQGTLQAPLDQTTVTLDNLNAFESGIGDGTTEICWTVSSATGQCPDAQACVDVIRRDVSIPNVQPQSATICESSAPAALITGNPAPIGANGEVSAWTALGAATFTPSGNDIQPTNTTPGIYEYVYEISNPTLPGSPVNYDTVTIQIDAAPSVAAAGTDEPTCLEDYQLNANIPTVGTGAWTATGGLTFDDASSATATASTLVSGNYTFTWTISNGVCPDETDDVVIDKLGSITSPDPGTYTDICETTTSVSLSGATPNAGNSETGTWTIAGPATISDVNDENATLTITGTGTVSLDWTISNGVCPDGTLSTAFDVDSDPSAADPGVSFTVCGDAGTLSGTNPTVGTGTWSTTGTITIADMNDATSAFNGLSGTANLTWTVSTGGACADKSAGISVTSTTALTPTVTVTADIDPACFSVDNVTYTAVPTNGGPTPNYDWTVNGSLVQSSTSATYSSSTVLTGQTVEVTLTSSETCVTTSTAVANTSITTAFSPSPVIGDPDQAICEDSPITLNVFTSGGNVQWFEVGSGSLGNTSGSQTVSTSGSYFAIEDNGVCPPENSDTVTITVDQVPVVSVDGPYELFVGESVIIDGSVSAGTPNWTANPYLSDVNVTDPTFSPLDGAASEYTLTLTAVNGICSNSADVDIKVRKPIKIPNAFTPNTDGENDDWVIEGLETYDAATLQVFNRWGTPVYKSVGTIKWWDGKRNGGLMPVATYYYILDLGIADDESDVYTGSVTLVR